MFTFKKPKTSVLTVVWEVYMYVYFLADFGFMIFSDISLLSNEKLLSAFKSCFWEVISNMRNMYLYRPNNSNNLLEGNNFTEPFMSIQRITLKELLFDISLLTPQLCKAVGI